MLESRSHVASDPSALAASAFARSAFAPSALAEPADSSVVGSCASERGAPHGCSPPPPRPACRCKGAEPPWRPPGLSPVEALGERIAASPLIDKIAFTGETRTGASLVKAAADGIKRVSLELGGKSPNIVFADADIAKAAAAAVRGGFGNAGQSCSARTRLLVERKVHDDLLEIERHGRLVDEREPRRQRELIAVEQPVGGLAAREHGLDPLGEVRERPVFRDRKGDVARRRYALGQRGAAGERNGEGCEQQTGRPARAAEGRRRSVFALLIHPSRCLY